MNQTRKMWASVVVVGVIVVAGASIAAAASAGRLEETRAVVEKATPTGGPAQEVPATPAPDDSPAPDDGIVVSEEVNPDPTKVLQYWTDQRMEEAEPMPMPEVKPGEIGGTE
jgi:hypothetical protein